jgi:divalent metal cation (Fe/Co/Zn/Cd) transporter
MAVVGLHASRMPPDDDHPYGHRKYETLAAAGIFMFLLLVVAGVLHAALDRLSGGAAPRVTAYSFAVMMGTLVINLFVVR